MSGSQVTAAATETPRNAPTARRHLLGRGKIIALALATVSAFGAIGAVPQATRAAATNGNYYAATVHCTRFDATLQMIPNAYPADAYWNSGQQIWYRFSLYSFSAQRIVFTTAMRSWVAYGFRMSDGPTRVSAPHGLYAVKTDYWWYTNGRWYTAFIWTQAYYQDAYYVPRTDGRCMV
jgi:hypothetical protein